MIPDRRAGVATCNQALTAIPVEGDASLVTLLARSMNQFPMNGVMPFNIIEP